MPLLNFAPTLTSVYLMDTFSVRRRVESVDGQGLATLTSTLLAGIRGIIAQSSPSGAEHRDDGTLSPRSIEIITRTPLKAAVVGAQGDVIVWGSDEYTVTQCDPHPHYPTGWYEAQATITSPAAHIAT